MSPDVSSPGADGRSALKPILRWAGSKRRQVPKMLALAPTQFATYYEPFAGSACFFLALQPEAAVLGDLNPHLVTMYRCLRRSHRKVMAHAVSAAEHADYYAARREFNEETDPYRKSGLLLYLNAHCFNGLYRENARGEFNVPEGSRTSGLPTANDVKAFSKRLTSAKLVVGDFENSLATVREGDFVYADPPFFARKTYGEYLQNSFSLKDIDRFRLEMERVRKVGAHVLISLPETKEVSKSFKGWKLTKSPMLYKLAGNGPRSVAGIELLIQSR
jgi:DNA adenine methylase